MPRAGPPPPERFAVASLNTIAVVGASLAGLRAVEALRRQGYEGRLVLVGAENRLPYDRPPLSKEVLRGDWEPERIVLRKPDSYDALDLDLRLGRRAVALSPADRTVELDDGERLAYDGLVIATGATPRTLPNQPALHGLFTLRTLDDSLAIRRELERGPRVAVIGAGFIGAEVAAVCRQRGLDVSMVEALDVPMSRVLGPEMGDACAALHRDHGVALHCGVAVDAIEGNARVERLRLSDGTTVDADVVVIGIGVYPETRWLESSGLTLDDGVVCDATCATGAPGVVAAGDVARFPNQLFGETMRVEHWTNASDQGMAAAQRLLDGDGNAQPYAPVPFVWSDQYDVNIQYIGHARAEDEVRVVRGTVAERKFIALYGRNGRFRAALGFNMPRDLVAYRRLLKQQASWADALAHAAESAQKT